MTASIMRWAPAALVLGLVLGFSGAKAQAQEGAYPGLNQPLFYNYYADGAGATPAQLYLSPRPVPAFVGHTYVTYPPLLPHQYLYQHNHRWVRQDASGRRTVTTARYRAWPGPGWIRNGIYPVNY